MTIVKGNFRPDILLIYEEVEWQLRRNGWEFHEYVPTSYYLSRPNLSMTRVLQSALSSLNLRTVMRACHDWKFFFEGGRMRLGRLLDFLSFSKYLDAQPTTAVFLLEQTHSRGACHAARLRGIPIITHQHGDYYHDRVVLTTALRDIEGPDTIRIVWNEESRDVVRQLSPRGGFRIAGSLKHAAIQRKAEQVAFEPGLVFFETIFRDRASDYRVAEFSAAFLRSISNELACPAYVAPHPLRTSVVAPVAAETLAVYQEEGIATWPFARDEVQWGICSDSNALFDLVAMGIPCLHLQREDSYLSIPDGYPGTILAEGDPVAQASEIIRRSDRTSLVKAQVAFLQEHKIGSPATVDRCFTELLAELSDGESRHSFSRERGPVRF